jgi:hypothetical protein
MSATSNNHTEVSALTQPSLAVRPFDLYLSAFRREFNPSTPSQQVLVDELARRADQMATFDRALHIVQSGVGRSTAQLLNAQSTDASYELALASGLVNEKAEAMLRQGLRAARGFTTALSAVNRLQCADSNAGLGTVTKPDPRFTTEASCQVWLVRRFREGLQPCRRCGRRGEGSVIAARHCWECSACKCQTGLRHGTVMESSSLPLAVWFAAIRIVLLRPTTSARELAKLLQISRVQTVRNMAKKIRGAMRTDTASALLAGLDEVYFPIT